MSNPAPTTKPHPFQSEIDEFNQKFPLATIGFIITNATAILRGCEHTKIRYEAIITMGAMPHSKYPEKFMMVEAQRHVPGHGEEIPGYGKVGSTMENIEMSRAFMYNHCFGASENECFDILTERLIHQLSRQKKHLVKALEKFDADAIKDIRHVHALNQVSITKSQWPGQFAHLSISRKM